MSTIYDGEVCMLCLNTSGEKVPAEHKIAEEYGPSHVNEFGNIARIAPSAYVCGDCFKRIMFIRKPK